MRTYTLVEAHEYEQCIVPGLQVQMYGDGILDKGALIQDVQRVMSNGQEQYAFSASTDGMLWEHYFSTTFPPLSRRV